MNFINSIAKKNRILHFFCESIFDDFFPGFRAKFQKIVTCAAFSIKFAKTNQKVAENFAIREKIHFTPYSRLAAVFKSAAPSTSPLRRRTAGEVLARRAAQVSEGPARGRAP